MGAAAQLALTGFRDDPFKQVISISGIDLTGATFGFAIREYAGKTGSPLVPIVGTTTKGSEGVRLAGVDEDENGIPISLLEIIVTKAHMQSLPGPSTLATDNAQPVKLYYDLQITPANDPSSPWAENVEQTWLYGDFFVNGSANT
jgi:hypothetical protein